LSLSSTLRQAHIERDGQFADAVEILAEAVGEDIRPEILSGDTDISRREVVALGRLAEKEPERAREIYTRATAGDGIALEPELVEAERKPRRSFRGRKRAFQILISLGWDMLQVTTPQIAEQVRQWGDIVCSMAREAQNGVDEEGGE